MSVTRGKMPMHGMVIGSIRPVFFLARDLGCAIYLQSHIELDCRRPDVKRPSTGGFLHPTWPVVLQFGSERDAIPGKRLKVRSACADNSLTLLLRMELFSSGRMKPMRPILYSLFEWSFIRLEEEWNKCYSLHCIRRRAVGLQFE